MNKVKSSALGGLTGEEAVHLGLHRGGGVGTWAEPHLRKQNMIMIIKYPALPGPVQVTHCFPVGSSLLP